MSRAAVTDVQLKSQGGCVPPRWRLCKCVMLGDILSLPSCASSMAGFTFLSWSGACIICSRSAREGLGS